MERLGAAATAASAWTATRTTLLSGCWAVRVAPLVWAWKRSAWLRGSRAPKRSRMIPAHSERAARNLATSSKKSLLTLKKKERRGPKESTSRPASTAACT